MLLKHRAIFPAHKLCVKTQPIFYRNKRWVFFKESLGSLLPSMILLSYLPFSCKPNSLPQKTLYVYLI